MPSDDRTQSLREPDYSPSRSDTLFQFKPFAMDRSTSQSEYSSAPSDYMENQNLCNLDFQSFVALLPNNKDTDVETNCCSDEADVFSLEEILDMDFNFPGLRGMESIAESLASMSPEEPPYARLDSEDSYDMGYEGYSRQYDECVAGFLERYAQQYVDEDIPSFEKSATPLPQGNLFEKCGSLFLREYSDPFLSDVSMSPFGSSNPLQPSQESKKEESKACVRDKTSLLDTAVKHQEVEHVKPPESAKLQEVENIKPPTTERQLRKRKRCQSPGRKKQLDAPHQSSKRRRRRVDETKVDMKPQGACNINFSPVAASLRDHQGYCVQVQNSPANAFCQPFPKMSPLTPTSNITVIQDHKGTVNTTTVETVSVVASKHKQTKGKTVMVAKRNHLPATRQCVAVVTEATAKDVEAKLEKNQNKAKKERERRDKSRIIHSCVEETLRMVNASSLPPKGKKASKKLVVGTALAVYEKYCSDVKKYLWELYYSFKRCKSMLQHSAYPERIRMNKMRLEKMRQNIEHQRKECSVYISEAAQE